MRLVLLAKSLTHLMINLDVEKQFGLCGSSNVVALAMAIELNLSSKGEMW
jgi:hypothetical protein